MESDMGTEVKATSHADYETQVTSYGIGHVEDLKVFVSEE